MNSRDDPIPTSEPPAGTVAPNFDYSALSAGLADDARATAGRIRNRTRSTITMIGRDLIVIKTKMEHGTFGNWIKAELGMTPRTAENYMNAAQWLEGKSETVSLLPPTLIYALAAPSAPAAVVSEVLAAVGAGVALPVRDIKEKLADAVEAKGKAEAQAKKSPDQIKHERDNERRLVAAREAADRKWREKQKADNARREEKAKAVAKFLVSRLGGAGLHEVFELMCGTDWCLVEQIFAVGGSYGLRCKLSAAEIEAKTNDLPGAV
jgi:hypothetical protein